MLWYAGAGVSQYVSDEYMRLAFETIGERVHFLTGLGSTRRPLRHWPHVREPACSKCRPAGPEVEAEACAKRRQTGTTASWPEHPARLLAGTGANANAFDEEGFYRIGDAVAFEDPNDPNKGLLFDGRIAEDFKLSTGTWVSTGRLRARMIDFFSPYVRDVVLTGPDRIDLGALVFPDVEACRTLSGGVVGDAAAVLTTPESGRRVQIAASGICEGIYRSVDARRADHAHG